MARRVMTSAQLVATALALCNGHVAMAGKWDVTVTVKRAGKDLGKKQFPVTAQ
jgi:hypothetical protein